VIAQVQKSQTEPVHFAGAGHYINGNDLPD
jgi:hypothetical protein